ncbi:serine/threonine-protein kinase KIN2 [Turnera subulata]|uniref:Kinesin-like protein n=1 Tax=Turnera subulata TaxID=218843 RepID=A0A9Q0FTG8_9ROSI|nr:serine/threonine-protein kinase KIN2 [Turnera subulata]
MSSITVCARFRPLSSPERRENGDGVCVRCIDHESFTFKDEKEEECTFGFDRVFYEGSEQDDVFQFVALPIVRDAVNGTNNGSIITYGQTGAGKTYSIEGPGILECDEAKKGLLPRVVDGLFECIRSADEAIKYTVKLSMVEIYMEKVRDLLDLTKDNILIKESKKHGIMLSGVTEELTRDKRVKIGKILLVDLAGSEKVEKTGAEGKVLEEAKTINKSLSALGNVVNALTCGPSTKTSHIPYRDSKLTRILQDALDHLFSLSSPAFSQGPELFILEGIIFDPNSVEDLESMNEDITARTISALQQVVEELQVTVEKLRSTNRALKARLAVAEMQKEARKNSGFLQKILAMLSYHF